MRQKCKLISYSGSEWAIRLDYSRTIAYSKLGQVHMVKNGIFYYPDVLFVHAII